MNERETPMTDAGTYARDINGDMCKESDGYWVAASLARELERMCAELAEALDGQMLPAYCSCKWCEMRKQALAKYAAMKEGK